jgi:transposase
LSDRQQATLDSLPTRHLKKARAYQIRLAFQDLYDQPSAEAGASLLKKWYFWATHSRLAPMIDAARTVKHPPPSQGQAIGMASCAGSTAESPMA